MIRHIGFEVVQRLGNGGQRRIGGRDDVQGLSPAGD